MSNEMIKLYVALLNVNFYGCGAKFVCTDSVMYNSIFIVPILVWGEGKQFCPFFSCMTLALHLKQKSRICVIELFQ